MFEKLSDLKGYDNWTGNLRMRCIILLSQFACKIGDKSINTWKERRGAGAFQICLTVAGL